MDITTLMKASHPLEISVTPLSTYSIDYCTENTFANCIRANKITHFFHLVFTKNLPPVEWFLIDLSIGYRACMSDELNTVEKYIEEFLIDLMAKK
jgi:hypothetical protein